MKKCLRYLFSALVLMCCMINFNGSSAEAAVSIEDFQQETYVDADGRSWLRLEFALNKETLDFVQEEVDPIRPKQLKVTLKDTKQGDIRSDYTLDGKLGRYMTVRADGKDLKLMVSVAKSLQEQEVKVYTMPKDKKAKKKFRLVIEVAADNPNAQEQKASTDKVDGVEGRTIVIDPGHGGSDSGAVGYKRLRECDVTFDISMKMKDILENSGAKIIMTRTTDVDVYGPNASASQELQARCDYVTPKTDIFVCVHANAASNPDGKGTETYYCAGSTNGRILADSIQQEMIKLGKTKDRGIKTANFYVLKHTPVPATLIETGFVTNPEDATLLADEDFRSDLALAICQGIADYFSAIKRKF